MTLIKNLSEILRNSEVKYSFSLYEGNNKYIFVSYSHLDGDAIPPILESLDREGFRIWYDEVSGGMNGRSL